MKYEGITKTMNRKVSFKDVYGTVWHSTVMDRIV